MANNTQTKKTTSVERRENIQAPKIEKIEIKFICDVYGDHGIFKKNQIINLDKKEAEYFVKIKVAVRC